MIYSTKPVFDQEGQHETQEQLKKNQIAKKVSGTRSIKTMQDKNEAYDLLTFNRYPDFTWLLYLSCKWKEVFQPPQS